MRAIIIYIRFTPITTIVLHICMLYTTHKKKQVVTTILLEIKIQNYKKCNIFAAAIAAAEKTGAAQGAAAGMKAGKFAVIESLKKLYVHHFWPAMPNYILEMSHYNDVAKLTALIHTHKYNACDVNMDESFQAMCTQFDIKFGVTKADGSTFRFLPRYGVPKVLENVAAEAELTAKAAEAAESAKVTAEITEQQTALIEAGFNSSITSINASIVAIVVIVLIMVIIYLILRYRRKKKMKKKLQYIKLLDE
ncbi:hypothetical protein PFFCH_03774 [Plasmodium falciparum FCH/4]|uniref:Surface antigen n=1 Tax=Plasmodium falciparum FCH/4 TaxID=1036724 RepID=A0A024VJA7_PLAFA|nr:hypothetical protein PFFCH_03774 [Plasmodium falciparum FCH/4]